MSGRASDRPQHDGPIRGREHDLTLLSSALDDGARLLVLTGGPGSGKTRLATELSYRRDVDAVVVACHDVGTHDGLLAAWLTALGKRHGANGTLADEIARALPDREFVVVLDDLPSLDGLDDMVQRLLDDHPAVRLVVTMRRSMTMHHGLTHRVGPLPVPPPDLDLAAAIDEPTIALFTDRAQAIDPAFRIDDDNVTAVAALCRRADGIPLAIALAAGRVAVMSPAALAAELDRRSMLDLVGGPLRDSIARSWALLSPAQRTIVESMSVLVGPASLETVLAICDVAGSDVARTVDDLTQLVDIHLVDPDRRSTGGPRFTLPGAVSEFARELLDHSGRTDATLVRLARSMACRARTSAASTSRRTQARDAFAVEFENLRLALDTAATSPDVAPAFTLQFAVDAGYAFLARGESRLLAGHLTRLLARTEDPLPSDLRGRALAWLNRCEINHTFPPDREAVTRRCRAAIAAAEEFDDPTAQLRLLESVAESLPYLTDPSVAAEAAEHGLHVATAIGDEANRGRFLSLSGVVAHASGRPDEAARLAVDAIAAGVRSGSDDVVAGASLVLRGIAPEHRPADAPEMSSARIRELARRSPDERLELWAIAALCGDQIECGDHQNAAATILELLDLAEQLDYLPSRIHAVVLTAMLAGSLDDHLTMAELLGSLSLVDAVISGSMGPRVSNRHAAEIQRARDALGEDTFREQLATGAGRSWAEAVAHARERATDVLGTATTVTSCAQGRERLTDRELDVLRLLATGATNKSIAATLGLRPKTIMHHNESIYRKLRVRGRAAAVSVAMRTGLLDEFV